MKKLVRWTKFGATVFAGLGTVLFGSVVLWLGVPLACGIGGDIAAGPWLAPAALVAATAIALNSRRRSVRPRAA